MFSFIYPLSLFLLVLATATCSYLNLHINPDHTFAYFSSEFAVPNNLLHMCQTKSTGHSIQQGATVYHANGQREEEWEYVGKVFVPDG